jgi:hypothetical protein
LIKGERAFHKVGNAYIGDFLKVSVLGCIRVYRTMCSIKLFKTLKILPIDKLIKLFNLKFRHNFAHGRLPLSFVDMWITNRARNPNLELRNAEDFYVPAHKFASLKRFPYFQFPKIWNEANILKRNLSKSAFIRSLKIALLNEIPN